MVSKEGAREAAAEEQKRRQQAAPVAESCAKGLVFGKIVNRPVLPLMPHEESGEGDEKGSKRERKRHELRSDATCVPMATAAHLKRTHNSCLPCSQLC